MNTYSFGYDFGNAETCGVSIVNGRKVSKSMPTAISQDSASRFNNLGGLAKASHYVYQASGLNEEFFIGDLAVDQGSDIYNGYGDPGRYWSSESLMALLTLSSSMIEDDSFSLNVVTGLPVESYSGDVENRNKIKKALEGNHSFSVNGRDRTINVRIERIIMEGAGAAIAYGTGTKDLQGVIDIGGRTTDLYGSYGQSPNSKYCHGAKLGVVSAANAIDQQFYKLYKCSLSPRFIRDALWAYATETKIPTAPVAGVDISIASIVTECMSGIERKIVSFIRSKWRTRESDTDTAMEFKSVTVVGGGAYYFFSAIKRDIPHAVCPEVPEQANALGYCLFAEQQTRRLRAIA